MSRLSYYEARRAYEHLHTTVLYELYYTVRGAYPSRDNPEVLVEKLYAVYSKYLEDRADIEARDTDYGPAGN